MSIQKSTQKGCLHSLFTELGREPGSAVLHHWWVQIYPTGVVEVRHHLGKWTIKIGNSIEIHDQNGFLCFVTPSSFVFHQARSPLAKNVIAELELPGGFTIQASEIYQRIADILKQSIPILNRIKTTLQACPRSRQELRG